MKKKVISIVIVIAIIVAAIIWFEHHHSSGANIQSAQSTGQANTMKVKLAPSYVTLYFSGNLQPAKQVSVISPNAGVVIDKSFSYGQIVKKGDLLFTIDSSKQESQFETALSSYLKAKQTFNGSETKLKNEEGLYKKGLVSRDEYTQTKNSYYLDQFALLQAQATLQEKLKAYKVNENVFDLTIADIRRISKALKSSKESARLKITAPADGVALFPVSQNSEGGGGGGNGKIKVGSSVKESQVLVTIGQMKGLSMSAKVNEIDINKIKKGDPAIITSVAFPNITLHGEISNIDAQAVSAGSLPEFNIDILVPKLSKADLKVIRVGMSAKATVRITGKEVITVPISAVYQQKGQSMVTAMVNGAKKAVPVQTGHTSFSGVEITSGLKPGDEILVRH